MNDSIYDWIIVGGGVSGITLSEILSREGKSVHLLEKNEKLASETSKDFHEWVHSGALYTLVPDNLLTLRYLLGATDDIIEYYSCFDGMNLSPSERGIKIGKEGWFNNDHIEFRYRSHKWNPVWLSMVSRSLRIIDFISNHDWLRRRAGSEYGRSKVKITDNFIDIPRQLRNKSKFFSVKSPDFTMNSRVLLSDILNSSVTNGTDVTGGSEVDHIKEYEKYTEVGFNGRSIKGKKVVITSPDAISKFLEIPISEGYAPMAIVENVPDNEKSFVELDYFVNRCINLLKKKDGIGQAGGITLNNKDKIGSYLDYVINEHKKRNPSIRLLDTYVGIKKELVQKGENRNYLYHINQATENIWSVVLGKFTLAFSMAPEFYRRVYNKNPPKNINLKTNHVNNDLIADATWKEISTREKKYGNN